MSKRRKEKSNKAVRGVDFPVIDESSKLPPLLSIGAEITMVDTDGKRYILKVMREEEE